MKVPLNMIRTPPSFDNLFIPFRYLNISFILPDFEIIINMFH